MAWTTWIIFTFKNVSYIQTTVLKDSLKSHKEVETLGNG